MKTARWLGLGQTALVLVLIAGCGRAPLTAVHGKVAYKGMMLQGGVIVFTPDANRGERGSIAVGKIREDGTYTLFTGEQAGASAGWYRVTVSSLAATSGYGPPGFTAPQSVLPEKYRDPDSSQLACEVKASRTNNIDFNLD
jgi:hypothetical protein